MSGRGAGGGADETSAEGADVKPQAHQGSCIVAAALAPATATTSAVMAKSVRAAAMKKVRGEVDVIWGSVSVEREHHAAHLAHR